jgi:RNA polymerase sigma factor (sigma-70 family)
MSDSEFAELYAEHLPRTVAICSRQVGSEADDVASRVWLRIWQKRATIYPATFRPFLNLVIRRACIDAIRRCAKRPKPTADADKPDESCANRREVAEVVQNVIAALPPDKAAVMRLIGDGVSQRDVAERLGMDRSTVRRWLDETGRAIRRAA